MLTVLDLFSGIGGFSLGLERTGGFRTVAFCEIDPFCRQVLAKHWPDVPIHNDIRELDGIPADVVCGGFPCQDVSIAGRRAGLEAARSGLWSEIVRLVGEIRPRHIIVENTPGLLSLGMGTVLGDLAALRYDAEWHCIPACYAGTDHIRDRVWIVAYPHDRKPVLVRWSAESSTEMAQDAADVVCAGFSIGSDTRKNGEDAARISQRLGPALSVAPAFSREYREHKPVLGRGLHGIPRRVDRLRALGNAVVPQVVEAIGHAILESERR